jgi:hypothetical protein
LRDLRDATLTASSVGGSLEVLGSLPRDAQLEAVSGRIHVQGAVPVSGTIAVTTHDGAIALEVGDPVTLDLKSRHGSVRSAITSAPGGGTIVARSFSGDINVGRVTGIVGKQPTTP